MPSMGNWGEIITEIEAERFVGREQELSLFQDQISQASRPRYLIFYITGQGGVGKTTLLNRYRELARDSSFLLVDCMEHQRDVVTVMGRFAQQLSEQQFPLKRFEKRYKTYLQKLDEIENDPEAPQGAIAKIGKAFVRAIFIGGDLVPGLRKGLDYLPQEPLETRAGEWISYLHKKLTNKDDYQLMLEPEFVLTTLFFEDLNEVANSRKVLFCFENFEVNRHELQEWIIRLPEYKPSYNIRIVIAGRDQPGVIWEPLKSVTKSINLEVFTEPEAQKFLDIHNIMDVKRRTEILECSGRLPVIMGWLAAPEGKSADPLTPTDDVVGRFLRWVTDPVLKRVALVSATPHIFNIDILKFLLEKGHLAINEQFAFDWLRTMPFVKQVNNGWQYHDIVRRMMLHHQRQERPQAYRKIHADLADFFNNSRYKRGFSDGEQWIGRQWYQDTLAFVYHTLVADPNKHWQEIMSLFVVAMWKRRDFAVEMIEMLNHEDILNELSSEQHVLVQLFAQKLREVNSGNLQDGFEMFDKLCNVVDLSSDQAKGYALAFRGECYQLEGKWERASRDFTAALQKIPQNAEIMVSRSMTDGLIGRYEEALMNFDRAIDLDEKNCWAIANRGVTYRLMGRYLEALKDFDRAEELVKEKYAEEVARDIIANRGLVYRQMGHHQKALADFDRAESLGKRDAWIYARRSMNYRLMGQYKEALKDMSQAIELDKKDSWYLYRRAQLYMLTGQISAFQSDMHAAIDLARATVDHSPDDWRVGFHLGLYYLILESFDEAEAQYSHLALTCSRLSELQFAEDNLTKLLETQPLNEKSQGILVLLQTRIAEIIRSES